MGLFDLFRAQPRWKHGDPNVRLAAVDEMPLEEQAVLAMLAREDPDARVRRAALRKVYDPALLKEASERDADEQVREEAGTGLLDLALGAFEDSSEAESLRALEQVQDPRHLATVAKDASAEAVSLAALARLNDAKLLASVARRARHAATRIDALARVSEANEVAAVAVRSEHRDVALLAVERLTDADHLRTVVAKTPHKAVARRAKALLHALEEANQPAASVPEAPAAPDWDAQRDTLCRSLEELASARDWRAIDARLAAAEEQWARLDAEAAADEARTIRFAQACDAARQASVRLKQEEAERARHSEQAAREHAERAELCQRFEQIAAAVDARLEAGEIREPGELDVALAEAEAIGQQWRSLAAPTLAHAEIEGFERRFDKAGQSVGRSIERARSVLARRARMTELTVEAEGLAGAPASSDTHHRWNALKQEWTDLGGRRTAGEELARRFEEAHELASRREAEAREQEQRRQREEGERVRHACERLQALVGSEALTLKDGERALKEIRALLDGVGTLSKKDRPELAERLKAIQTSLAPRVHELREADDWARWANVGVQEDLCRRAEALREVAEPAEAVAALRELQQQWKRANLVPRDKAKALWERFKNAGDEVRARAETYFAEQSAERGANLARKEELCRQAEALAESTEWIKTAEAIKRLQAEWTAIGPVPRGHEKAAWERFRAACDRFFTRRREDLSRRKEEWASNLARKEALIGQVEALKDTTDWDHAVEEVKRIQAEWKTIGPVRKNRSEEVWQRFRAACDNFFERFQQRDQAKVAANVEAREQICHDLEALMPESAEGEPPSAPEGLRERVDVIRGRWQHAASPIPRDVLARLTARFNEALSSLVRAFPQAFEGSDLDLNAARQKAEQLCERVEKAVPVETEAPVTASPATILAARLKEALAANTIRGGVAVADADAKWRAAVASVKEAQAEWAKLPRDAQHALAGRFERACRRFFEAAEKRRS